MNDTATHATQLLVVGAGPGGYTAAFHAAELGVKVTLVVDEPSPGGVCLHRGCMPSKALLHVARLVRESREAAAWGLTFGEPALDLPALRSWVGGVVDGLAGGVVDLCKRRGVELLRARATFVDSSTVSLAPVEGVDQEVPDRIAFERAIVATGSVPVVPPVLRVDDPRVMDSTAALALQEIPGKLLVVGGGYIGLELTTVYGALGSEVTVVERLDGLLPGVDRDLVRPLAKRLGEHDTTIHVGTEVESVEAGADGLRVSLRDGEGARTETFDRMLVAVGRRPVSGGFGLDRTEVRIDERGFVEVDAAQRTADRRILAIGDVAGQPMLAHKAMKEGKVAAEVVAGHPAAFDSVAVPAVVFTDPEIAWCGLTESEARERGREVRVARFPWGASGRAATLGRPDGLTKVLLDPETERVLGVGIVGAGAGELIAEGVLAVEMGAVARDLADSIHPHPTLSETVGESAEVFFGLATHLYRPRRPGR